MSRLRVSSLAWGLVATVLAAGFVVVWVSNHGPSPDPHGARMKRLQAVVATLPSSLPVISRQVQEPVRGDCDGQYGWNPVSLRVEFSSGRYTAAQVTEAVRKSFMTAGWHRGQTSTQGQFIEQWSAEAPPGALAYLVAQVGSNRPQLWTLTLTAAPRGTEVGC